jgi:transposase InsO family protein
MALLGVRGRAWVVTTRGRTPRRIGRQTSSINTFARRNATNSACRISPTVATWRGDVYVAFAIDVFARRIVGWRVSASLRTISCSTSTRWSKRSTSDARPDSSIWCIKRPWYAVSVDVRRDGSL